MSNNLFYIAFLPPSDIQRKATEIKHYFADTYKSKAALKSPPHITLQPPFFWKIERLTKLKEVIADFAEQQKSMQVILDGFAAFKPRVIYIDVHRTPELLEFHYKLMMQLESSLDIVHKTSKTRPFTPHMTVGFKDLTKANFYRSWNEFKDKSFDAKFTASELTLLHHNGRKWEIDIEFPLSQNKS